MRWEDPVVPTVPVERELHAAQAKTNMAVDWEGDGDTTEDRDAMEEKRTPEHERE